MYELLMMVDELKVRIYYTDFTKAIIEFKECVEELLRRSGDTDDIIMKISDGYGICMIQNEEVEYKLELKNKEK